VKKEERKIVLDEDGFEMSNNDEVVEEVVKL
jgi:hypothetical protein